MKQKRHFILNKDGKLNYYKDSALYKGTVQLQKETRLLKSGKLEFQIVNPTRTYCLIETDKNANSIETWIEKIQSVITNLSWAVNISFYLS